MFNIFLYVYCFVVLIMLCIFGRLFSFYIAYYRYAIHAYCGFVCLSICCWLAFQSVPGINMLSKKYMTHLIIWLFSRKAIKFTAWDWWATNPATDRWMYQFPIKRKTKAHGWRSEYEQSAWIRGRSDHIEEKQFHIHIENC